ncbi:MAG TPA: TetR/AcrR family transcriptional regulator [Mucilaginibacter sp.]|nr:TetR/AcrR family transcriptional regulator [Mucilaginibacter sp.]
MRTRNVDKENLVKQKSIELIVKEGLEGFSMNKLAKACKISVNTLYIYYKDRDDLIIKIACEEGKLASDAMIREFDCNAGFVDGLRAQWKTRYKYLIDRPLLTSFFEKLQSSTYQRHFMEATNGYKDMVSRFMQNAIDRGEIDDLPLEVYWALAFAPLYTLITFHHKGLNPAGKPFKMNDKLLWKTFDLVVKALKK